MFIAAAPAYANLGSGIVVAGYSHLIFLNFVIALVEAVAAVLLLRIPAFRTRWLGQIGTAPSDSIGLQIYPSALGVGKAYIPLLLANLVSAFIGLVIMAELSESDLSWISLSIMRYVLIGFIFATWLLTILIEWPFVRVLINATKLTFAKPVFAALVLCVVINTISYIGLFFHYKIAGDTSLITQAKYDPAASFLKNKPGHVYYIDSKTGVVYQMNLDGSEKESLHIKADRLLVTHNKTPDFWDLRSLSGVVLKLKVSRKTTNLGYSSRTQSGHLVDIDPTRDWYMRELRDKKTAGYDLERRNGMVFAGFTATNKQTGQKQDIGLETVFSLSTSGDVNLLPDDIIIWRMGNRILAYDLKTNQVSQLALGSCPVVTLD
jgi:hypothetical protein